MCKNAKTYQHLWCSDEASLSVQTLPCPSLLHLVFSNVQSSLSSSVFPVVLSIWRRLRLCLYMTHRPNSLTTISHLLSRVMVAVADVRVPLFLELVLRQTLDYLELIHCRPDLCDAQATLLDKLVFVYFHFRYPRFEALGNGLMAADRHMDWQTVKMQGTLTQQVDNC